MPLGLSSLPNTIYSDFIREGPPREAKSNLTNANGNSYCASLKAVYFSVSVDPVSVSKPTIPLLAQATVSYINNIAETQAVYVIKT